KQIRPTDVSKVLSQLHLVSERRTVEQPSFTPVDAPAEAAAEESPAPVPSRPLTDSALREHFAELRRALVAAVDTQTDRLSADVRGLLAEMRALLKSLPPPEAVPPPARPASSAWAWLGACVALTIALVSSALAWRTGRLLEGLTIELTQLRSQSASRAPARAPAGAGAIAPAAAAAGGAVSPSGPAPRAGVPSDGRPMVVSVPFGADPLGGARLEAIGKLLYRLARQKVAGLVDIRSFAGRFCLLGSAVDGYSLAPEETPFSKCDLAGNPPDEALTSARRTPLPLATLIARTRLSTARHVQSMLASTAWRRGRVLERAAPLLAAQREVLLDCGAGVRLQCFVSGPAEAPGRPVVLLHGWEGSADSLYLLSLAQLLFEQRFEVVRLNLRDHGDTHHLNRELFHSCRLPEVVGAVRALQQHFAGRPLQLVGFSLGGNF